jgi:hypothetical protein
VIFDVRDFVTGVSKRKAGRRAGNALESEEHCYRAGAEPATLTGETHAEAAALSNAVSKVVASHGEWAGMPLTQGSITRRRSRAIAVLADGQGGLAGTATTPTGDAVPASPTVRSPTNVQVDDESPSPSPPPIASERDVVTSSPSQSSSVVVVTRTAPGKRHADSRVSCPPKHKRASLRLGPVDTSIAPPDLRRCSSCCFRTDVECERQMVFLLYESAKGKADYAVVGRDRFGAYACIETSQKCSVEGEECQHVRLARQAQGLIQAALAVTAATTDQERAAASAATGAAGAASAAVVADETQADGAAGAATEHTRADGTATAIPTPPAGVIVDMDIHTNLAHRVHHSRRYSTLLEGDSLVVLRTGRTVSCLSTKCGHITASTLPTDVG